VFTSIRHALGTCPFDMSRFPDFLSFLPRIRGLAIVLSSMGCLSNVQSEEVSFVRVKVEPQRIEFRLKFNLQTLQKFILLDSDHNGLLTKKELSGQELAIREYLSRHFLITLNGRETNLGFPKPMERQWEDRKLGKDVPQTEFSQRWVEFAYLKSAQPFIAEVSIRSGLFKDANDLDHLEVVIEQGGRTTRVNLSRSNPEYQWKTGFSGESVGTAALSSMKETSAPVATSSKTRPSMIVFGLVALAVTWLLLRRVHQISRGSFYIGPRE
jgi:hypothetical protein